MHRSQVLASSGLTAPQQMFADEWLTGAHSGERFSVKESAKYAGYSQARARNLLKNKNIAAYIEAWMIEHSMDATKVFYEFSQIAEGHRGEIITKNARGELVLDVDKIIEHRHLVDTVEFDKHGRPKIKYYNRIQALQALARILGMNQDSVRHLHQGNVNLNIGFKNPDGSEAELVQEAEVVQDSEQPTLF